MKLVCSRQLLATALATVSGVVPTRTTKDILKNIKLIVNAGVATLIGTDQVTPDMELPSWIIYLCVPLGSYLMCFRFLQVARNFWRTGHLPHHDETQVEGIEIDAPGAGAAGITR